MSQTSTGRRNSSKVNLLISLGFHGVIVLGLIYFAAREGLLGKELKKITVQMVQEKAPEKPKKVEPEKLKVEPPKPDPIAARELPQTDPAKVAPVPVAAVPSAANVSAPPSPAPPAADLPSLIFEGGKPQSATSDPVLLYKGLVEYTLRSNWNRPSDLADDSFVAEVEITLDKQGKIARSEWKKGSGNRRWDDSVRQAIAVTPGVNRSPPASFPDHLLVRFDVQQTTEPLNP